MFSTSSLGGPGVGTPGSPENKCPTALLFCSSGGAGWPKAPEATRKLQPLHPLGALGQVPAWGLWLDPPSAASPGVLGAAALPGCALPVKILWLNFGLLLKCCACQRQNWRVPLFLAPPLTLFFPRSLGQRCPEWSQVPSAPVFKLWLQPELSSVP